MSDQKKTTRGADRPSLALGYVSMTRGEEIRRARQARGWSQRELGLHAGVGQRTIVRIESGNDDLPSVPAVQRALGIGEFGKIDDGVPLHRATAAQLMAELGRRLIEHEQWGLVRDRITVGEMPSELIGQPGISVGPNVEDDDAEPQRG